MATPKQKIVLEHILNSYNKSKANHGSNTYYNDNYAVENFVNVFTQNNTDSFRLLVDPTYIGFKIFFHFDSASGLFADETHTNSALAYLKRIGQTKRYELLKRFINVLSRINSEIPWVFQTIEGLDEMYNNPFHEVYVNKELTIGTIETIDGKIASIGQMYRNIVYDYERKVEIVPVNLRRFSMSIYTYDFRNFDNLSQTAVDALQTIKNQDIKKLNHVLFDVGNCEFNTTTGGGFIAAVSNNEIGFASNTIKIQYNSFSISSLFSTILGEVELSEVQLDMASAALSNEMPFTPKNGIRRIIDNVKTEFNAILDVDSWKTKLRNVYEDVKMSLIDRARAELTRLYLGNVHGFDINDVRRRAADPDYRVQFNDIYSRVAGTKSLKYGNTKATTEQLGNANSDIQI